MLKINNSYQSIIVCFLLLNLSCKENAVSQNVITSKKNISNCFILKPIIKSSQSKGVEELVFPDTNFNGFLDKIPLINSVEFDSAMQYVTNYENQKKIFINYSCFSKLNLPDSCNLVDIYFNSRGNTSDRTESNIEFVSSYKKNIFKFGNAIIFNYHFKGVSEVEPHSMHIIIKIEDNSYKEDYKGIVLCSDDLEWKDYPNKGYSIPLYIEWLRGGKDFAIPMYFDGEQFIPIGHYKIGNWNRN